MYVKVSMKPVPRSQLSEHELKRCRAIARGRAWDVWEEDIWWWSLDRRSWNPLDEAHWPRKLRWLLVETEEGIAPALIWEANHPNSLPALEEGPEPIPLELEQEAV
jgi:hypothetical protein